MSERIETVILSNLINNEEYCRKTIPFIQSDYFTEHSDQVIFKHIEKFFSQFNKPPTQQILKINIDDGSDIKQSEFDTINETIDELVEQECNQEWLFDRTEKFCKDQSLYNAIAESISILDGKNSKFNKEAIPSLLQEALSISFDKTVGHDYQNDAESRYDSYHLKEERIPFGLNILNKITRGGLPPKTLNVVMAGCVHPETIIRVRSTSFGGTGNEVEIGNIQHLFQYVPLEVSSPDGWVRVTAFVDKGWWEEYYFVCGGNEVRCNELHKFETRDGFVFANDLIGKDDIEFLTPDGWKLVTTARRTGVMIPIVDIQVDHPNHRYYTNGISSHNTNVGKSIFLCDTAAKAIKLGKNCLYITLEMAETRVAERIDCNLMETNIDDLYHMRREAFNSRISDIKSKSYGKLIIKEFPTASAHAGHFKALLDELKIKKNFKPDLICLDYLNICACQRLKGNSNANSYTIIKSIAEELRGLAVEYNVPILSATQSNRSGSASTDVEMTDTSESFGLPMTVDWMCVLTRTDDLDEIGQIMVKQLKSRYNDVNYYKRFVLGLDISKFTLYDVDTPEQ